jgi:hypothetical protein
VQSRLSHRARGQVAVLPEGDVDRPVVTRGFGELPRAVERIHDPDPGGAQPSLVVGALLGEHRVARPVASQQLHQQLVGGPVTGVLQLAAGHPGLADLEQPLARRGGEPGGQLVVVGVQGTFGRGHGPDSNVPWSAGYEQLEAGSHGSASFGSHLHGAKEPKSTVVVTVCPSTW